MTLARSCPVPPALLSLHADGVATTPAELAYKGNAAPDGHDNQQWRRAPTAKRLTATVGESVSH